MSKALVLAEKPSVGRDIGRVLGCESKGQGYMEGDRYVVTWALGHLVSLAAPEKYNKAYNTWTLESLPMIPSPFKLEVISGTGKQYHQVRKLMERKDINEIIIATDAGREGELVARWIIDYAHCKKPIKRLWISSVTDMAIKDGFTHLADGRKYDPLYRAARARAEADWIVGLNGTRALTVKHNASLSMGRVQTPAVGLVNEREQYIRQFVPESYYEVEATVHGIKVKAYEEKSGSSRYSSKKHADEIFKACQNGSIAIRKVKRKEQQQYKNGFYDLTELQRDANRQYGYSAKETLNAMQGLYERHKVLTYPRTDSAYITEDIVPTLVDRLRACRNGNNKDLVGQIIKSGIKAKPSFVNGAKVGDHHGIIPTEVSPDYHSFSPKEQKIYNLVIQRFLAALMPPYRYEEVSVEGVCQGKAFKGKSISVVELGWKSAYETSSEVNTSTKIILSQNQQIPLEGLKINSGKTAPPQYLTEADLLGLMEKSGLGTVATRADIIEKIIGHAYVDKQKQYLRITKTGKQLLDLVPDAIKSKELTAKWEKDLELIAKNQKQDKVFMDEICQFTRDIIGEIRNSQSTFKHDNVTTETCPNCGQKLLMVQNKYGRKLVCRDRDCGYKKNIAKVTNARCPNCHKKMEMVGEGDNQTFVCKCGHREKLSAFNKRKAGNKSAAGKREVQKYLKKAGQQDENFNNPFASLLADLKDEDDN